MERPRLRGSMRPAWQLGGRVNSSRCARTLAGIVALGLGAVFSTATPARAQPPQPQVPDISERSGLVQRFSGDAHVSAPGPPPRLFLQHAVRRSGDAQPPQLVPFAGSLWTGLEDPGHREHLSLLVRIARPEHHRFLQPPLAPPAPVHPGAGPPLETGRHVLPDGQLRPDLRPRPDRARSRPLSVPVLLQLGSRRLT